MRRSSTFLAQTGRGDLLLTLLYNQHDQRPLAKDGQYQ